MHTGFGARWPVNNSRSRRVDWIGDALLGVPPSFVLYIVSFACSFHAFARSFHELIRFVGIMRRMIFVRSFVRYVPQFRSRNKYDQVFFLFFSDMI